MDVFEDILNTYSEGSIERPQQSHSTILLPQFTVVDH